MSRLRTIETASAEPKAKVLLESVQKSMGMTPNLMRTMADSPVVLESYLGFKNTLSNGILSDKLREQISLVVSELNRCQYCLSAHTAVGKMMGISAKEITDSRRAVSSDYKTEVILRFARKVVSERGLVSDEDVAQVRSAGANDAEIAEVVANVALNIFTNYYNHVADTEVDFPLVDTLDSQPSCACGCS